MQRRRNITWRRLSRTTAIAAAGLAVGSSAANAAITIGVNDARGLWLGSPNLGAYPVAAHKALALKDMTAIGKMKMSVRVDVRMSDYDPNNDGTIDTWAIPDAMFKTASQTGVNVLPLVQSNVHPLDPAQRVIFGRQVAAFVARYRQGGTYWAANPGLTPRGFTTAELWNEPNRRGVGEGLYYQGGSTDYGRMLGKVWETTQVASPGFRFISGGLADLGNTGQTPVQWLTDALAHVNDEIQGGSWYPFFPLSAVGIHPYGAPNWTSQEAINNTQQMINLTTSLKCFSATCPRIFYSPKPIAVTEFGWKWSGYGGTVNVYSDAEIAQRYTHFLSWFASVQPNGSAYAYNYRQAGNSSQLDDGFGLFGTTGTLLGDDNTQADSGRAPLQALSVLTSYTGAPYTP